MDLNLIVKNPWFAMEASGVKKEEYREISGYWVKRLLTSPLGKTHVSKHADEIAEEIKALGLPAALSRYKLQPITYDRLRVCNGYAKDRLTYTAIFKGLTVGQGRAEWGAPEYPTFIIQM